MATQPPVKQAHVNEEGHVSFWNNETNSVAWIPKERVSYAVSKGLEPLTKDELGTREQEQPPQESVEAFMNKEGLVSFWDEKAQAQSWVPPNRVHHAVQIGLKPLTTEEHQAKQAEIAEKHRLDELDDSGWEAFASAGVSSATFGAPEMVAGLAGNDAAVQRSKDLREAKPWQSFAGDVAGVAASAFFGPVGLAGRAGAGIAKGIAGRAIAKGATSVGGKVLAKGTAASAALLAEGASIAASDEILRQTYEKNYNVEEIAKKAVTGVVVNGSFPLMGKAFRRTVKAVKGRIAKKKAEPMELVKDHDKITQKKRALEKQLEEKGMADGAREVREDLVIELKEELQKIETKLASIPGGAIAEKRVLELTKRRAFVQNEITELVESGQGGAGRSSEQVIRKGIWAMDKETFELNKSIAKIGKTPERIKTLRSIQTGLAKKIKDPNASPEVLKRRQENLLRVEAELNSTKLDAAGESVETLIARKSALVKEKAEARKQLEDAVRGRVIRESKEKELDRISKDISFLDKRLSYNRTNYFRQIARPLAFITRNPILGGAAGIAMIGGSDGIILGGTSFIAGKILTSKPAVKLYKKAGKQAMKPTPKRVNRLGSIKLFTDRDLEEVKEEMQSLSPEQVAADAYQGYMDGGLNEELATEMSNFELKRLMMLQSYAEEGDRIKFSKISNALSDPREIMTRLKSHEATREDIQVLRRIFPKVYEKLVIEARQLLLDKDISASLRQQIELLLNPRAGSNVSRIIQQLNQPVEGSPNPRGKTYNAATNMQRISKGY